MTSWRSTAAAQERHAKQVRNTEEMTQQSPYLLTRDKNKTNGNTLYTRSNKNMEYANANGTGPKFVRGKNLV